MKRQTLVLLHRVRELSPIVAIALLLLLPMMLPDESVSAAAYEPRNARIAEAMEDVPWQIGRWRGQPADMPKAAQEVLHANAMLSRQYIELGTGLQAMLVIVHTSDMRDMQGHYPPKCYPAHGWELDSDEGGVETIAARMGESRSLDCTRYHFHMNDDWGSQRRIRVFNFFVLPDGRTARDEKALDAMAGRTATSAMGVAQIQIGFGEGVSEEDARRAVAELLEGIEPLFVVLGSIDHVESES